jgi:hypothetical protein
MGPGTEEDMQKGKRELSSPRPNVVGLGMIGNTARGTWGSLGSWLSDIAKKPIAPLALLWPP